MHFIKRVQTTKTNFEKLLGKKVSRTTIEIRFNLLQFCPSEPYCVDAVILF